MFRGRKFGNESIGEVWCELLQPLGMSCLDFRSKVSEEELDFPASTPSGKLERAATVGFQKNTPHRRQVPKVQGSVDPRFPAGLRSPAPEILEFLACCDSGKSSSNFPKLSRSFPLGAPEKFPETATAFSSFLTQFQKVWTSKLSSLRERAEYGFGEHTCKHRAQ